MSSGPSTPRTSSIPCCLPRPVDNPIPHHDSPIPLERLSPVEISALHPRTTASTAGTHSPLLIYLEPPTTGSTNHGVAHIGHERSHEKSHSEGDTGRARVDQAKQREQRENRVGDLVHVVLERTVGDCPRRTCALVRVGYVAKVRPMVRGGVGGNRRRSRRMIRSFTLPPGTRRYCKPCASITTPSLSPARPVPSSSSHERRPVPDIRVICPPPPHHRISPHSPWCPWNASMTAPNTGVFPSP